MKLIVSIKQSSYRTGNLMETINSGFGNSFHVVKDEDVDGHVAQNVARGFVCHVFNYTDSFQGQNTIVRANAVAAL